ncbi:MAG: hypothetical protein K6360_09080 [Deltaproteobacteria bacterium]
MSTTSGPVARISSRKASTVSAWTRALQRIGPGARLYFDLVMLSYNLMNWFKEKALGLKLSSCWPFQEEFLRAKAALT